METRLYHIEQLRQSRSAAQCLALLDEHEREQHQKRGHNYAYTRSELKLALAQRSGLDARSIQLAEGEHGKPYCPHLPELHFNLSHSRGILGIAMDDKALGLDLEWMRERTAQQKAAIARRLFQEQQQADLAQHHYDTTRFYAYWCGTEALIKQAGLSLWQASSLPPFLYHEDGHMQLENSKVQLQIRLHPSIPNYMMAIAHY